MPALQQMPALASHWNPESPADQALAKIVDLLHEDGYGFTVPAWNGDAYLKISNVHGAVTDLTISGDGNLTWSYRSTQGLHVDPARLTVIAITLLDPDAPSARPDLPSHSGRAIILNAASYALFRHGLTTSRHQSDPDAFTILTVTNPVQPVRGAVQIANDGELVWHTRTPHHRDGGLTLPDIAGSIAWALVRTQHALSRVKESEVGSGSRPARDAPLIRL